MLHLIRQSPYQQDISSELSTLISNDDDVLLIDDGVYFCQSLHFAIIQEKAKNILIVDEHLQARGITFEQADSLLPFAQIAEILVQSEKTLTWQL